MCGGDVIPKYIISGPFNYVEQNGYLEILIGCVWETVGEGGGLVALQSLSIIKKGTGPFNFQSNELLLKLLRQQTHISKFISDLFHEKTIVGGGYPPSDHSES